MVQIQSKSSTTKLRFSQQGLILLILIASLMMLIPSLMLVGKTTNSPTDGDQPHHNIRGVDDHHSALPTKKDAHEIEPPAEAEKVQENNAIHDDTAPKQFKTGYPGFTTKPSVMCGAHKAPSCDQCPQGNGASWCNGECEWMNEQCVRSSKLKHLHPEYFRITERYAFQPVFNQNKEYVNVIMARAPFRGNDDEELYKYYKDDILFIGISSFEAYPLQSPNPYSGKFNSEYYLNMFPGFLHMMHKPNQHFPSNVTTMLMSQSDFMLDEAQTYYKQHANEEKLYDFVYTGGDQDVGSDCQGWASYNKNFSFVREALEVMCSPEFDLTGVLIASKNKDGTKVCSIPEACKGKIVQTPFMTQNELFGYYAKARWALFPQVCDASPRASSQALSLNLPLLMNQNIMGGWKYLKPGETGEFFHDKTNFKDSLRKIVDNTRGNNNPYKPLEFIQNNYGNVNAGPRLLEFVKKHWPNKIVFPEGTTGLVPTGA